MLESYDVLIIGGGPAGSSAAAFARKKNLRTLVLEKCEFPRFRIGESLLPMGNAILRETGAWPKVEATGFMPKYGAEFYTSDGSAAKTVVFAKSLIPGLESTYHVERARFDAILLDHARSLGADVRMQATVTAIESSADGNRVTFTDSAGEHVVNVPWVLDSSGRESSLATEPKRSLDASAFPKRMAVYSHFHGVKRAAGRDAGNIIVVRIEHGWFWLIPLDADRTSVGFVTTVDAFKADRLTPEDAFNRAITRSPKLRQLLSQATPAMEFRVTTDYSYSRENLAQDRLVLVGDTAGFFDPIFSSGVYMALETAKRSVEMISAAHAQQRPLTKREQARYTRGIKRHGEVFQKLIAVFYDDVSFEVFMCQTVPWRMASGLTSIVAGHAKLTWPLWWRFKLFLLVCYLQHHWKLVKPEHIYTETLVEA
jgi:flavin-dependent dehydrogenase